MIMIAVMVIIMMIVVIITIIIIIIIIIIVVVVKVVQADYPRVLISKFLSFFSVFVSATLPYKLGSTDKQHHFSDANYKVTWTLKILQYKETDHFTAYRTYSTILFETRET